MSLNSYQRFMDAVRSTQILRARKNYLFTFGNTKLPYILIAESAINQGSTIIRQGEVNVEKPHIVFTDVESLFEGFDAEKEGVDLEQVRYALMSRGISFPHMNYKNNTQKMDVVSEKPQTIIDRKMNDLEDDNDSRTALISCREDLWSLSLMHYVLGQVIRSSSSNMQEYLERYPL